MTPYVDPVIKKYQELIEAAMPGVFKGKYQGDPVMIPASRLPALIISKGSTRVGPLNNVQDEHGQQMILTVVTDIRDEINDETQVVPGIAQLYDILEGREDGTYKLKANCVLNILRSNILVDAAQDLRTDISTVTQVDYGMTVGKRERDAYAVEGQVQFVAHYLQQR